MTKRSNPLLPSRPQLLLASLLLLVGVFSALKSFFDYVSTGTVAFLYIVVALFGLVLGGRILRRVRDR